MFNYLKGSYKKDKVRHFSKMQTKEKEEIVTAATGEISFKCRE